MAGSSVPPVSPETPSEIQSLIARAGLALNPGQVADLVLGWRQVATLIAEMPRDRGFQDDMALAFRLPPPRPPMIVAPAEIKVGPPPSRKQAGPKAAAASTPARRVKPTP